MLELIMIKFLFYLNLINFFILFNSLCNKKYNVNL